VLGILERSLSERFAEFSASFSASAQNNKAPEPIQVTLASLSEDEAEALLKRCIHSAGNDFSWVFVKADTKFFFYKFPAMLLDAGTAVIRVSVEDEIDILLEDKRSELAAALLGGRDTAA
jgi:hypothetical protein